MKHSILTLFATLAILLGGTGTAFAQFDHGEFYTIKKNPDNEGFHVRLLISHLSGAMYSHASGRFSNITFVNEAGEETKILEYAGHLSNATATIDLFHGHVQNTNCPVEEGESNSVTQGTKREFTSHWEKYDTYLEFDWFMPAEWAGEQNYSFKIHVQAKIPDPRVLWTWGDSYTYTYKEDYPQFTAKSLTNMAGTVSFPDDIDPKDPTKAYIHYPMPDDVSVLYAATDGAQKYRPEGDKITTSQQITLTEHAQQAPPIRILSRTEPSIDFAGEYYASDEIGIIPAYHQIYQFECTEDGAVVWKTLYPNEPELIPEDNFVIQCATKEDFSDAETIGTVAMKPADASAEQISYVFTPTVPVTREERLYYRIQRESTLQWGWDHAFVQKTYDKKKTFIRDLCVSTATSASEAKGQLIQNGYKVLDRDLNYSEDGQYIYLGYKTTHNPAQAITMIKVVSFGWLWDNKAQLPTREYQSYKLTPVPNIGSREQGNLNQNRRLALPLFLYYSRDKRLGEGDECVTQLFISTDTEHPSDNLRRVNIPEFSPESDAATNLNADGLSDIYIYYDVHKHTAPYKNFDLNDSPVHGNSCCYVLSGHVDDPDNPDSDDPDGPDNPDNPEDPDPFVRCHPEPFMAHPLVEPTCSTEGHNAFWQCLICEKLYGDEEGRLLLTALPVLTCNEQHLYDTDGVCSLCGHLRPTATDIDATAVTAPQTAAYYDLFGRRADRPQPGINIVRLANGSTAKILIK